MSCLSVLSHLSVCPVCRVCRGFPVCIDEHDDHDDDAKVVSKVIFAYKMLQFTHFPLVNMDIFKNFLV